MLHAIVVVLRVMNSYRLCLASLHNKLKWSTEICKVVYGNS